MISVIIPVFNNPKSLAKTLKSLSVQSVAVDLEVVIVNDGSEVSIGVPFFISLQDRVRYYKVKHGGAAVARNFGFEKSKGEFVFFCDSDVTFLKKNALELMLKRLQENPNKAYCYCGFLYGIKAMPGFVFDEEKLKQNNYISTMSLVRRSALEKLENPNVPFDESLTKFQDWDLWRALLQKEEKGVWINKLLWRASWGGKMSSWLPKIAYKLPFLRKAKKFNVEKQKILQKYG